MGILAQVSPSVNRLSTSLALDSLAKPFHSIFLHRACTFYGSSIPATLASTPN